MESIPDGGWCTCPGDHLLVWHWESNDHYLFKLTRVTASLNPLDGRTWNVIRITLADPNTRPDRSNHQLNIDQPVLGSWFLTHHPYSIYMYTVLWWAFQEYYYSPLDQHKLDLLATPHVVEAKPYSVFLGWPKGIGLMPGRDSPLVRMARDPRLITLFYCKCYYSSGLDPSFSGQILCYVIPRETRPLTAICMVSLLNNDVFPISVHGPLRNSCNVHI